MCFIELDEVCNQYHRFGSKYLPQKEEGRKERMNKRRKRGKKEGERTEEDTKEQF